MSPLKFIYTAVLALLLISSSGCFKHSSIQKINPHLQAHFNYRKGSYWIFQDSATGQIDSFVVVKNERLTTSRYDGIYYIDMYLNEYTLGNTQEVTPIKFTLFDSTFNVDYLTLGYYQHMFQFGDREFFLVPPKVNFTAITNHPFVVAAGNNIPNVTEVFQMDSFNVTNGRLNFKNSWYFSDRTGLTKMIFDQKLSADGHNYPEDTCRRTWNLLRYYLLKG